MSAVVGNREELEELGAALEAVVAKHAQSSPELLHGFEIHASEIMNHLKFWNRVPQRLRFKIMEDVYKAIGESRVCVFVECIRIKGLEARGYRHTYPAREIALQWLLEKVNNHARSRGLRVTVYADNHHTAPDSETKLRDYAQNGTIGYRSTKLTEITQPIVFVDSGRYRQLQAADACTYLCNRVLTIVETDPRAAAMKTKWHDSWKDRISINHVWP